MKSTHRAAGLLAVAAIGAGLVSVSPPATAGDDDERVEVSGPCTGGGGRWELKAKFDDGRIEWEFEVDTNVTGQSFAVRVTDNGAQVFRGQRVTRGPSGSFSLERTTANRAGTDVIRAVARRGENQVCRGTVRL